MTKKKKRRFKKQSKLSLILNRSAINPARTPALVRFEYFNLQSPFEVYSNFNKVVSHPFFTDAINLTLTNRTDSVYKTLIPNTNLLTSINWIIGILSHHKDILVKYIELENLLTKAILSEDYDNAILLLNTIDGLCGISTWSITVRASILKQSNQYDSFQEYLDKVLKKAASNNFFKSICRNITNRYDSSSISVSSSYSLRKQILRNFQGPVQSFLIYKIIPRDFAFEYKINYEDVLNYEKNSSIIDLFKATINFMASNVDSCEGSTLRAATLVSEKLLPLFPYHILSGLAVNFGAQVEWEFEEKNFKLIDSYTSGNYKNVCSLGKEYSEKYISFAIFEIIAKSVIREKGRNPFTGLKSTLLENTIDVFLKQKNYNESLSNLLSISHAFSGIPWFQELHFLISREANFIDELTHKHLSLLSSAYSDVNSPRKLAFLPYEQQEKYLRSCNNAIKNSLTIDLFKTIKKGDVELLNRSIFNKIEPHRLLKYKAKLLIESGQLYDAISILEKLITCKDLLVTYEAVILLVDAYIETKQGIKAIELFATTALDNTNIILRFNTFRICVMAKELINESSTIYLPITLSLHSRLVSSDFDSTLRYSFEKYLTNLNLDSPLDLRNKIKEIGETPVNYFYEHICTPNIMKLSFLFDDKKDIENCRISICTYLIDNNISKDTLINEVKEITKEQAIKKAVSHVDQSRIHADLSGLKDNRSVVFRNIFNRFLELSKNDYSKFNDEIMLEKLCTSLPQDVLYEEGHVVHLLDTTLNEKNTVFHKLIAMVRDEFTFGEKGLNNYLNTRIRHGVLPSTIRTGASKEHLITSLESNNGPPKSNEYWKNKLFSALEGKWVEVDKAFSKFTNDYESIIFEINEKWLQIFSMDQDITNMQKGGLKSKALFNYSISNLETFSLQKTLVDDDYDNFIRVITHWLWSRTETNLQTVKDRIRIDANKKFNECYANLSKSINNGMPTSASMSEVNDAISRSKDSLHKDLAIIASWFTKSDANTIKYFDIETAIDIASRSSNVQINQIEVEDKIVFEGKHLTSFVDIFYILFENAATKSQVPREELVIDIILVLDSDNALLLNVTNNCNNVKNMEEENKKLDYYRDSYGNSEIINKVTQGTGGTGIFRIWKTFSKDIEVKHDICFGYKSKSIFEVTITLLEPSGVLYNENIAS